MRLFRKGERFFAPRGAGLLVALLVAGCGIGGEARAAGVSVDQLNTDVVFGYGQTPPTAALPAPPALPQVALPQPLPSYFSSLPLPSPIELCATAPSTSAPAQLATSDVTTMPSAGQYKWIGGGRYTISVSSGGSTSTFNAPLPAMTEYIRHVKQIPDPNPLNPMIASQPDLVFSYETLQPFLGAGGGYFDFFWQVKSNAPVGDPQGGLVLTEIDKLDFAGKFQSTVFKAAPNAGLLLLNLPAEPGAVGVSTPNGPVGPTAAADTSGNGNDMSFNGAVSGRERVDACGTWLQGWAVDGTLANGPNSGTKVHFDVATQFGAVLIALDIDGAFLGETFAQAAMRQGQTSPDPLPKEYQ